MSVQLARYGKTSQQFRRWLEAHPNASINRKVEAFNSIADTEFYSTRIKKTRPKAKSKV